MKRIQLLFCIILLLNIAYSQTAIEFQSTDGYIKIEDHAAFQLDEFTIECWIMINDTGYSVIPGEDSIQVIPVISRGHEDMEMISGLNFLLGLRKEDHAILAGVEASPAAIIPFKNYSVAGYTSLQNNLWYHIAITFNGIFLKIYVNGKLETSMEIPDSIFSDATGDIGIGKMFDKNENPSGAFLGIIDAIRIWNYERTHNEIINYINTQISTPEPGLLVSLNMDEGEGTTINNEGTISESNITCVNYKWTTGANFETLTNTIIDNEPVLRIGLISDPQYCDHDPIGSRYYRNSLNKLRTAIDTFNNKQVNFTITLGDIIDRDFISFDSILPIYGLLNDPYYFLLGNHEFEYVNDTLKDEVTGKLNLPDYYYSFDYENWKFIILDGTELAEYTRVIHPELAEEGDSLWQEVQGQANAEAWNGGISRTQQTWMKQELEEAYLDQQNVILFGHFQLYPDNHRKNLWNNHDIITIIEQYPNVIAYINGHFHDGNYGFKDCIHYYTNYAMVESDSINSYSILEIYTNKLKLNGYGYNYDKELTFKNIFKNLDTPQFESKVIHYNTKEGDIIGRFNSYPNYQYSLIGDTSLFDNDHFNIGNDTLYLISIPDLLNKNNYKIKTGYIDKEFDTASIVLTILLDTNFVFQKYQIPDKMLPIDSALTINLDSIYIDYSKNGINFEIEIQFPEIISYVIDHNILLITPLNQGYSEIYISLYDSYTDKTVTNSFNITVYDSSYSSIINTKEISTMSVLYPNPVSNEIHIKYEYAENKQIEYNIYNQYGARITSGELNKKSERNNFYMLAIDDYSSGLYFIELNSDNIRQIYKFIIQ